MTNEQFLITFERHLNVGGPQREEIIAELNSHLKEQSPEKLGDPKELARKSNRVHIGWLSSFSQLLVIRLLSFVLFEFGWIVFYIKNYVGPSVISQPSWVLPMTVIAQLVPILLFIYGSYIIAHLRHRWVHILLWSGSFSLGWTLVYLWQISAGYVLFSDSNSFQNVFMILLGQFLLMWLVYVTIAIGIMFVTEGKNILWPHHRLFASIVAFVTIGFSTYFIIPLLWHVITDTHYTESMVVWDEWIFKSQYYIASIIGLIGAVTEWIRHTRIAQSK